MTWFAASIVIGMRRRDREGVISIYENVFLVEANSVEEAIALAEEEGKEEAAVDDDNFRINDHPAERLFAGIRKLIEITNAVGSTAEDPPRSGAEISCSKFEVSDEETLQRFGRGECITVLYIQ